jgi:anti-sigma factor ChrR (cupin superfamily)
MVAGSTAPGHHHDHIEELYVLEGDCYCAGQCLHAGDYHRAEGGSTHGATFTEHGCLMIVHTSRSLAAKSWLRIVNASFPVLSF